MEQILSILKLILTLYLGCYAIITLHEMGHYIPAKIFRFDIKKVTIGYVPVFQLGKFSFGAIPLTGTTTSLPTKEILENKHSSWFYLLKSLGGIIVQLIIATAMYFIKIDNNYYEIIKSLNFILLLLNIAPYSSSTFGTSDGYNALYSFILICKRKPVITVLDVKATLESVNMMNLWTELGFTDEDIKEADRLEEEWKLAQQTQTEEQPLPEWLKKLDKPKKNKKQKTLLVSKVFSKFKTADNNLTAFTEESNDDTELNRRLEENTEKLKSIDSKYLFLYDHIQKNPDFKQTLLPEELELMSVIEELKKEREEILNSLSQEK